MRMKNHSISKAEHLPSFWYRVSGELGDGLLLIILKLILKQFTYPHSRNIVQNQRLKTFFFQISFKVTVSWFSSSFFKKPITSLYFFVYIWRISLLFNKIVVIWNKRNHLWMTKPELGVKQIRLPSITSNVINNHKKELWKTVRQTSFQKTQSYSVSIWLHHVYP